MGVRLPPRAPKICWCRRIGLSACLKSKTLWVRIPPPAPSYARVRKSAKRAGLNPAVWGFDFPSSHHRGNRTVTVAASKTAIEGSTPSTPAKVCGVTQSAREQPAKLSCRVRLPDATPSCGEFRYIGVPTSLENSGSERMRVRFLNSPPTLQNPSPIYFSRSGMTHPATYPSTLRRTRLFYRRVRHGVSIV